MSAKINKSKLNLFIDIVMFVIMIFIAGIGFLIKYVLVPGFKRNDIYGSDVELYYWEINRHQWGTIHLRLSFFLLFLLLLHIIFHWKQIVCIFKCIVPARIWRITLTVALGIFTVIFGIMPLFLSPEIKEDIRHCARSSKTDTSFLVEQKPHKNVVALQKNTEQQKAVPIKKNHNRFNHSNIEIFGYMTINEVAAKYHVSANDLASCIHVPLSSKDKKLGKLKKHCHFQLSELKNYIEKTKPELQY